MRFFLKNLGNSLDTENAVHLLYVIPVAVVKHSLNDSFIVEFARVFHIPHKIASFCDEIMNIHGNILPHLDFLHKSVVKYCRVKCTLTTEEEDFSMASLITVKTEVFRRVVGVFGALELTLLLACLATIPNGQAYFYLTVALAWLILSLKRVDTEECAGITFFGSPVWMTGPGLKLIPWGLLEITYLPGTVNQEQFPAEPELIFKGPDDQLLPEKSIVINGEQVTRQMVRPIRVTTAGPDPKRKRGAAKLRNGNRDTHDEEYEDKLERDILDSRMALEISFFVRWRILSKCIFDFIINAGGDVEEANKQMRDAGEQLFAEEFATRTPGVIIQDFAAIRGALENAIKKRVVGWGVEIIQVGWTSPDLGITVSQALRDIPANKARAIATRVRARADAYNVTKNLEGEGEGLKAQARKLGVTGADVLAARVAHDSIGKGDVILGTEGLAQVFGLIKAVKGGMEKESKTEKKPEDKGE